MSSHRDSEEKEPSNAKVSEVADYVSAMCAEMAKMAGASGFSMVTYLLKMAEAEAERIFEDSGGD